MLAILVIYALALLLMTGSVVSVLYMVNRPMVEPYYGRSFDDEHRRDVLRRFVVLGAAFNPYVVRHQLDGEGYPRNDAAPWVVVDITNGKIIARREDSMSAGVRALELRRNS